MHFIIRIKKKVFSVVPPASYMCRRGTDSVLGCD